MVWIHGGAHVSGCAKDGLSEASDLALQGTATGGDGQIVVALQYRLGPMGFFALPELRSEDPNGSVGNYGILDQLEGLRWVQNNIAAFGGDPNNVTIFGESAGGFSTYILLASPLGQGLFDRAITESGNYGQALALEPGVGAPAGTFGPTSTAYQRGSAAREQRRGRLHGPGHARRLPARQDLCRRVHRVAIGERRAAAACSARRPRPRSTATCCASRPARC